jgi:hypothetical protein
MTANKIRGYKLKYLVSDPSAIVAAKLFRGGYKAGSPAILAAKLFCGGYSAFSTFIALLAAAAVSTAR